MKSEAKKTTNSPSCLSKRDAKKTRRGGGGGGMAAYELSTAMFILHHAQRTGKVKGAVCSLLIRTIGSN